MTTETFDELKDVTKPKYNKDLIKAIIKLDTLHGSECTKLTRLQEVVDKYNKYNNYAMSKPISVVINSPIVGTIELPRVTLEVITDLLIYQSSIVERMEFEMHHLLTEGLPKPVKVLEDDRDDTK